MEYDSHLLFFSGTLILIIANLYGGIIKRFYKPKAYYKDFSTLFPAQKILSMVYFAQMLQIPYLFHVAEPHFLMYANAFALVTFSAIMAEMYLGYFFLEFYSKKRMFLHYLPLYLTIIFFLCDRFATNTDEWFDSYISKFLFLAVFAYYFTLNLNISIRLKRRIREINESNFSNPDNFPTHLAEKILWMSTSICGMLFVNMLISSPWAKFFCDILLSIICFWFTLITIDPWRTVVTHESKPTPEKAPKPRTIRTGRAEELAVQMRQMLEKQKLYTDPDLNVDKLTSLLGTNRNYMNEVIQFSGFKSFFDMINHYRVEYAAELLVKEPDLSILQVATNSGFSSQSYMSRTFKLYKKTSPTAYRNSFKAN